MSYFLKYVIEGRLDKVEEILDRNKKWVFLSGDIIDLSGRVFTRITAFQYATWALDKEMWELILKYLPEKDAYDQLIELEQNRPDITQAHGTRFNFSSLLDAYQRYIDNFDAWNWEQRAAWWCKEVGGAQRQMPAWFVYVFCEEGEDKAWPTNDFKKNFTRDPAYLRWWFGQGYNNGKVEVLWAPIRAELARVWSEVCPPSWSGIGRAPADRQHLNSCCEERTSGRDSLSDYLRYAVETKSSPATFNNSRK